MLGAWLLGLRELSGNSILVILSEEVGQVLLHIVSGNCGGHSEIFEEIGIEGLLAFL